MSTIEPGRRCLLIIDDHGPGRQGQLVVEALQTLLGSCIDLGKALQATGTALREALRDYDQQAADRIDQTTATALREVLHDLPLDLVQQLRPPPDWPAPAAHRRATHREATRPNPAARHARRDLWLLTWRPV